jgi:hypothetical protein
MAQVIADALRRNLEETAVYARGIIRHAGRAGVEIDNKAQSIGQRGLSSVVAT